MSRLAVVLLAGLALVLVACDTEPPTDVGYFDATVQARVGCIDTRGAMGGYDAEWRIAYRQPADSSWTGAAWHAYSCPDEQVPHYLDGSPFSEQLTGLRQNRQYQYRLEVRLQGATQNHAWYDSAGTENGTSYDSFTTDAFPTVTPDATMLAFRNSIGVNTKTAFDGTPMFQHPQLKAALQSLGIRRIRDGIWRQHNGAANGGWEHQVQTWPDLYDAGIRAQLGYGCVVTSVPHIGPALAEALQRIRNFREFATSWENPNEVNHQHSESCDTTDWVAQTRAYAQEFKEELAARNLDDRPIVGPSCGFSDCEHLLGDLSPWVDAGNVHPYRGEGIPETAAPDKCDEGTRYLPAGGPCYITEFGWALYDWSDLGGGTPSERVQAVYTLRAYLSHFQFGVPLSHVHQLVDLGPESWYTDRCNPSAPDYQQCLASQRHEASFGLYRHDWSPRLVATAISRMNSTIGDGAATLAPLAYRVNSGPSDLRRLVFRRADGKYVIALWRPIVTGLTGTAGSTPTQFQIPDAESVVLHRPIESSGGPTVPLGANGTFTVNTSSEPEFLIVTPRP